MIYTTTKCPHCGYRTRNRESGVPKVELGQTLACCPMCCKPIIDPIYTEYEFMSEREQEKWSTNHLTTVDTVRGVIMLILGVVFFIIGVASGDSSGIILALLVGGGLICMGVSRFMSIQKARELNIGEQAIYESLLRTSNKTYVELLTKAYGKERTYNPLSNRSEIIEDYKKYSTEDIHKRFEDEFLKLLNIIEDEDKETNAKKAKSSYSFVDGGALVAGAMAIPSAIVGAKQNKELANKNECIDKNEEKFTYCTECGMQIFNDEENCSNCGLKNTLFSNAQVENNKITSKKIVESKRSKKQTTPVGTLKHDNNKSKIQLSNVTKNKLLELKELYDDGLITKEEYEEKRKKVLEEL